MHIIPVLDLLGGQVVRGVAGRRAEYRPVVSLLTRSSDPVEVASAFRRLFGIAELYVADLNALTGGEPDFPILRELQAAGFRLWVDAGVRDLAAAEPLAAAGTDRIVLGLETLDGPEVLEAVCRRYPERAVFSLDLKDGTPMGRASRWGDGDAWSVAREAVARGAQRMIVLDLARVGVGSGTGTEELCRRLRIDFPQVEVMAGGGVRGPADLRRLKELGVSGVLVASALHDGRLSPEDLAGT